MTRNHEFYEKARIIDQAMLLNVVSEEVFPLLKELKYENYFFSVVRSVRWFKVLKDRGYFTADKAPGSKRALQEGYFTFPTWNALPYIEKITKQVAGPGKENYIDEVLRIIREVTQYHLDNQNSLDNFRTWWYFVNILLNLPASAIPPDITNLIPVWLDSKFDNSLPGSDIATKLLPKFLNSENSEDYYKAEKIIQAITAIKRKKSPEPERKGILGTKQYAETIVDSYWLEESFKANSKKIGEVCSEKLVMVIAERLKEAFRYEYSEHQLPLNVGENEYQICITHDKDFEFFCEVHRVLSEKDKYRSLEQKLLDGVELETDKVHNFAITNCLDKTTFVSKMIEGIREKPELKILETLLKKNAGGFYEGILSDYSYIWFPSIDIESEYSIHGAKQTLAIILRDILQAKAQIKPERTKKILASFFTQQYQYPLFKRMVIFTIAQNWDEFTEEFDALLKKDTAHDMFDNPYYQYDISQLLKRNVENLNMKQKERIRDIIEMGPTRWLPEEKQEEYIERWKQKWYSVLKSDSFFSKLYKKQTTIKLKTLELEIKPLQIQSRVGPGPSPLSREDLLAKTNSELVDFLTSFRTKDSWEGPTVGGLAQTLEAAAESDPGKFVEDLMPFVHVGYNYIYYLLSGLKSAWSQKKPMDWHKLLAFLQAYTNRDLFWNDELMVQDDERGANHQWVMGIIAELIQEGARDDVWSFPEELLVDAKQIVFTILDKEKQEEFLGDDALSHALNSLHGKAITTLLFLALRVASIDGKKGTVGKQKWAPDVKERYVALLEAGVVEAYTFLGYYMPNLYDLDSDWIKEKIQSMPRESKEPLWLAFMQGYLLGDRLYTNLYELMRPNYERALSRSFKNDDANRKLVEHIASRYLDGVENIEDPNGLFHKLLYPWELSQIENVVRFFWHNREYLAKTPSDMIIKKLPEELEQKRQRIISFWEWIYKHKFSSRDVTKLTDDETRILASLSKLTVFLRKIDEENVKWLTASIPHAKMDVGFDTPFFLEYLNDLKDADPKTTKHVGILLKQLAEASAPDFKKEDIQSIVDYLYETKVEENINNANDICNIYGSKGLHFLRYLWEKNNPL